MDARSMLLADAISVAIESQKKIILLKRIILAMGIIIAMLILGYIL